MDLNVWTVTTVTFIVLVSHGAMFFWKLFHVNHASTAGDMCDFMNMKTIDCLLSVRRDEFKTKMAISSNYVMHFLHLLATA